MKHVSKKALMILLISICAISLASCKNVNKEEGDVGVSHPPIPAKENATNGDIGVLLLRQQTALKQCNANFEQ